MEDIQTPIKSNISLSVVTNMNSGDYNQLSIDEEQEINQSRTYHYDDPNYQQDVNEDYNELKDIENSNDSSPIISTVGSNRSIKFILSSVDGSQYNKEDDNDTSDEKTIGSTIFTADGIADPISFQVNCLIVFLGDMARGIFFPTMWNLVQTLGGDQVLLGYVVASFSFGRMLVLPLFGSWSILYGYKWTLKISTFILLLGTVLFAQVLNVGTQWFLLLANTIIGIGSGTLGVTFAYASEVTPKRHRTGYLAWVAAVQYAGTTATPFIGSLFVVLFANENGENKG